jgi:hypothetical protein
MVLKISGCKSLWLHFLTHSLFYADHACIAHLKQLVLSVIVSSKNRVILKQFGVGSKQFVWIQGAKSLLYAAAD